MKKVQGPHGRKISVGAAAESRHKTIAPARGGAVGITGGAVGQQRGPATTAEKV